MSTSSLSSAKARWESLTRTWLQAPAEHCSRESARSRQRKKSWKCRWMDRVDLLQDEEHNTRQCHETVAGEITRFKPMPMTKLWRCQTPVQRLNQINEQAAIRTLFSFMPLFYCSRRKLFQKPKLNNSEAKVRGGRSTPDLVRRAYSGAQVSTSKSNV